MDKPECQLLGLNGNVYVLIGAVKKCLRKAKLYDQEKEFMEKAFKLKTYQQVLTLIDDYVEIH
jgi:hypothetical protein